MGLNFVHRDLKPSNILITRDKTLKITDFGLVKIFKDKNIKIDMNKNKLSGYIEGGFISNNKICGTPGYISPEQLEGINDIDIRSDIYSFGCILYEMVCRRPVFIVSDNTHPQFYIYYLSIKHLKDIPEEPISLNNRCPKELNDLIMKCLEKNRDKRFRNFTELRDKLANIYYQITGEVINEYSKEELEIWELLNKGNSLYNLERYEEAIKCYDDILNLNPTMALAWVNKGMTLETMGKLDKAILCYDQALEINGNLLEALFAKAYALTKLGKYEEAINLYNKVLEIDQNFAEAWNNKGTVLYKLGFIEDALKCFEEALKINPNYEEAWKNKGSILEYVGNFEEALECYDKALNINPKYAEAWFNKGLCLIYLNMIQEAKDAFLNFLKYFPNHQNTQLINQVKMLLEQIRHA